MTKEKLKLDDSVLRKIMFSKNFVLFLFYVLFFSYSSSCCNLYHVQVHSHIRFNSSLRATKFYSFWLFIFMWFFFLLPFRYFLEKFLLINFRFPVLIRSWCYYFISDWKKKMKTISFFFCIILILAFYSLKIVVQLKHIFLYEISFI